MCGCGPVGPSSRVGWPLMRGEREIHMIRKSGGERGGSRSERAVALRHPARLAARPDLPSPPRRVTVSALCRREACAYAGSGSPWPCGEPPFPSVRVKAG